MAKRGSGMRVEFRLAQMESQLALEIESEVMEQNKQRMLELGLVDLAITKLAESAVRKALGSPNRSPASDRPVCHADGPVRRSSRLKGTGVDYYKDRLNSGDEHVGRRRVKITGGSKPETYTAEHEKLLGNYERPWICDANGLRIYDSSKGKTCHQCRLWDYEHHVALAMHCRANLVETAAS